ncbi:MAG: glycosyl transferase [Leptolyngbya sp. ERB_1_1]
MNYHIAMSRAVALDQMEKEAMLGESPRHIMNALSQRLNARIHAPGSDPILPIDYLRAKLMGKPEHWALARTLSTQLTSNDIIYCTGEDVGIPIAAVCGSLSNPPQVVVQIHNAYRPRSRFSLKLFQTAKRTTLLLTNTQHQVQFLKTHLNLSSDRVSLLLEQTDLQFFTPGPASPNKRRAIVASVGLEKRDYRLLASATADLNVDVKISGFSADVKPELESFPRVMPANMTQQFYKWRDLAQLYRDADVVVVSLLKSQVTSGVTTLLEAMACCRPVIVTATPGLVDYVASDAMIVVPPSDRASLRSAIEQAIYNPRMAEAIAKRGYALAQKRYNSDRYVVTLASHLQELDRKSLSSELC